MVRRSFRTTVLVAAAALLAAAPAEAQPRDKNGLRLNLGAGLQGRSVGGEGRAALSTEATLTFVPLHSLSVGLVGSGSGVDYAYAEIAVHFLVSVGIGGGYAAYATPEGREGGLGGHAFVGLPVPLTGDFIEAMTSKHRWFFYLLPFYRASLGPWPGVAHEGGCMLKLSLGLKATDPTFFN